MDKKEMNEILGRIKMEATHLYFKGEKQQLTGFYLPDGRINDSCLAVLAADYLVLKKKVGFRIAHRIVSELSNYMQMKNKMFYQLTLKEYNKFCSIYTSEKKLFDEDIFDVMRIPVSVKVCAGELNLESLFKQNGKYN